MRLFGFGMSSWLSQVTSYKLENEGADERGRNPIKPYRSHTWTGDHSNWWDNNTDVMMTDVIYIFQCTDIYLYL